MAVMGASKPKKSSDLSTLTDDQLSTYEKSFSGRRGIASSLVLGSIAKERERRKSAALAKPPETPAAPDTTQAASQAQKQALDAAGKRRKRAAAGAAGFVRPLQSGTQSSGMAVMPVIAPLSLLGG